MKLFRHFFYYIAVIAIVFISSFDSSASTCPHGTFYDGNSKTSYDDIQEKDFVYNQEFFDLFIGYLDASTPFDTGNGIVISGVDMSDGDISISVTVSKLMGDYLNYFNEDVSDIMKQSLAQGLYDLFNDLGTDDEGNTIIDKMVELDINVNLDFKVEGESKKVMWIHLPAEYIESAGNPYTLLIEL